MDKEDNLLKIMFLNTLFVYGILIGAWWVFIGW